jgi:hypothetical protein
MSKKEGDNTLIVVWHDFVTLLKWIQEDSRIFRTPGASDEDCGAGGGWGGWLKMATPRGEQIATEPINLSV